MRFFIFIFFTITLGFLLVSCGNTTTPSPEESGLSRYNGVGFSLKVPASWEQVDISKVSAPIRGKFEIAFRSIISKRGFMNNIVILSDTLMTDASSGEYARQSMLWASREYLSLQVERSEAITFDDGSTSQLNIFRAKYNEVTEERLFFQTAKICGNTVYLITLGLSSDASADAYGQYEKILSSFTCSTT